MLKSTISTALIAAFISILSPMIACSETLMDEAVRDFQFQDYQLAEGKFKTELKSSPNNMTAHYYLGIIYQQQKKYDLAIKHLEIVAKAPVKAEGIDATLARTYLDAGKPEKALPILQEQYKKNANNEQAAFDYAKALEATNHTDEAAETYQQIIDKKGPLADASKYQLGQLLSNLGAYTSAVEFMQAINPSSPYGGVAKNYQDALLPATKPLSLYLSSEFFYNDNPGTSSSSLTPGTTASANSNKGSQGATVIGALNSRSFEPSYRTRIKFGYLYYGTFYQQPFAKDYNFVGHFINPSIGYKINTNTDIELKGDAQFFFYNQQKLSQNYGGTLTTTYKSDRNSINLHMGFLKKNFTDQYKSQSGTPSITTITSLAYLDANTSSIGLGGTLTAPKWGGSITADYTYNMEKMTRTGDNNPVIAAKAKDSEFREQAIRLNTVLPLSLQPSRLAILGGMNYSYKDYINAQSGNPSSLYPTLGGQRIHSILLTYNAQAEIHLWEKYGINLNLGFEQSNSHSQAAALTYKSNRYFGQLSGSF